MTHSDWYTPKAGSANTFLRDCALTVKNISSFVIDECHQSDKHCTRNLSPDQNSIPKTESTISQHTGLLVHNFFVKGCILTYYLQNMWISTILDNFLKKFATKFLTFWQFFLSFLVWEVMSIPQNGFSAKRCHSYCKYRGIEKIEIRTSQTCKFASLTWQGKHKQSK